MSIQPRAAGLAVTFVGVLTVAAAALATAVLTSPARHSPAAMSHPVTDTPRVVHAVLPSTPGTYLGVYEPGTEKTYGPIDTYAMAIGRQPNLVLYYNGWGGSFPSSLAAMAREHGATLVVDLDPDHASLGSIAHGKQDGYLRSFAEAVLGFGHPVVISFGHEMNGDWYPWGWTHASPTVFVQAWRHIVTVFRDAGADNVTWLWTVNDILTGEPSIRDWWPGSSYVTWVGIDGYFYEPTDTFQSVYAPTIAAIHGLTAKPILISETAVGQVAGQAAKIPLLFAGTLHYHLLGLLWFDVAQDGSLIQQNWRLEGHPAAIAAFRRAVKRFLKQA
jgi:Glycosyl hydrolase family 26